MFNFFRIKDLIIPSDDEIELMVRGLTDDKGTSQKEKDPSADCCIRTKRLAGRRLRRKMDKDRKENTYLLDSKCSDYFSNQEDK